MQPMDNDSLRHLLGREDVIILDARSPRSWERSEIKIEHARRFDPTRPVASQAKDLPRAKEIVIYCEDGQTHCPNLAGQLEKLGFTKVFVLAGGFNAWEARQYPTWPKDLS